MWDLIVSVPDHCLSFYFPKCENMPISHVVQPNKCPSRGGALKRAGRKSMKRTYCAGPSVLSSRCHSASVPPGSSIKRLRLGPKGHKTSLLYQYRIRSGHRVLQLTVSIGIKGERGSSIGSTSAWHASGPELDPHVRHILSWRLGHEKHSKAILPLPLIQEEQLSVTGERMCTQYW